MKIHVEVEISPEEMRRLVGLPDAQPLWDAVYKRIGEGDSEMIQQMATSKSTPNKAAPLRRSASSKSKT